jgi:hypothetical protein
MWYDSMNRKTVASIGIGLLVLGFLLGAVTLIVDRAVRGAGQRASHRPVALRSRVGVVLAMTVAAGLAAVGSAAVAGWS